MKWHRNKFAGKHIDRVTEIPYEGYTYGDFGVARVGKRVVAYTVIHIPTGVCVKPRSLHLPKLADAKAYAEAVVGLWDNTVHRNTRILGLADGFRERIAVRGMR